MIWGNSLPLTKWSFCITQLHNMVIMNKVSFFSLRLISSSSVKVVLEVCSSTKDSRNTNCLQTIVKFHWYWIRVRFTYQGIGEIRNSMLHNYWVISEKFNINEWNNIVNTNDYKIFKILFRYFFKTHVSKFLYDNLLFKNHRQFQIDNLNGNKIEKHWLIVSNQIQC